jgi:hypothetical protein
MAAAISTVTTTAASSAWRRTLRLALAAFLSSEVGYIDGVPAIM